MSEPVVGIAGVASYLPDDWMSAAALASASGIPESVLVERFGLAGKHVADPGQHVTDLAREAAVRLLAEADVPPGDVDAVVYFGSTWKNYPVWQAAPRIAHELGCDRAFALELDYTSCGSPVALRVAKALITSDPRIRTLLLVGASCESRLVDYGNQRARFMFSFGDGAVAALLARDHSANQVLETAMITDGSLSLHVKVPAGGSALPASSSTVAAGQHLLDVADPAGMRDRLGGVSLDNFLQVAADAVKQSGLSPRDVSYVVPIHMKRSMQAALLDGLGLDDSQAVYLADTGHMSGVDNLLGLDRLARAGRLTDGDVVLLLAAGIGYTWAATVVRWGRPT
ncbi:MAG TPA: 3-oxoacyl-ACP synthase [Trebonia sp.]|jgi:3-oxoacyl-[acyl-carrier-protein] synthase-3|nr:3-oxoacyl-ACP synthase [Trebonia sp.]